MNVRRELETVTGRTVGIGSVHVTLGSSRRLFVVTSAGEQILADTRAMQERLWHGVTLPVRLRNA